MIADFRERKLLFIDLEMTGLNPLIHEIIEMGAIVVNGKTLEIEKEYEVKVRPEHIESATPEALEINGYNPEKWKDAISLNTALTELGQLAPEGLLAGWNIGTDKMFLEIAYIKQNLKFPFDYHALDIVPMAWLYGQSDPGLKELRLSSLCERLGLVRVDHHRALADIRTTVEVFKVLNEKLKYKNEK